MGSATRNHSRAGSLGHRLITALSTGTDRRLSGRDKMAESKSSLVSDERVWYDQFTSTDWVHDSIADGYRIKALRARKDFRGRILAMFDGAQGWVLAALIGGITALIAYCVDVSEAVVFDFKEGHCRGDWLKSRKVGLLDLLCTAH